MIKNKNTSIDKYMDYSRIINIFKIHLEKYKYARIILEKNKYNIEVFWNHTYKEVL